MRNSSGTSRAAAAAARLVPEEFRMDLTYVDVLEYRRRLGNAIWDITNARGSLVVPAAYRAAADAGDPRIPYVDEGRRAQDSELHLYAQRKYRGYDASMRLASGLEARYIAAEAEPAAGGRLALVNERRALAGEPPLGPDTPERALLAELMRQRSFDFWMEAKRAGDIRRHGALVPFLPGAGEPYYKPRLGTVAGQRCWPVPDTETRYNPHWR